MDLILVPKGTTAIDNGSITVGKDFYIGKYEVTQKQWYDVMLGNNNNISTTPATGYGEGNDFPVYYVSWYDCLVFCNRLSKLHSLTPVYSIKETTDNDLWGDSPASSNADWNNVIVNELADGYRLPMNNEWEYSARGGVEGSPTLYSGSYNIDGVAWYAQNSGSISHIVGTKLPNELGIYDMSGNMWEWGYEWYSGYEGSYRYLRGGSWDYDADSCRVDFQTGGFPFYRQYVVGLRVCRSGQPGSGGSGGSTQDKEIKLDIGLYSSALSPAYYSGYFNKMYSDGLSASGTNTVYLNPNVLPKIYEYGIEVNGNTIQYGMQAPLIPQEEKEIYIENYIMPESSTFNSSGFVSDIDKYYGKYGTENSSTLPYNQEFYSDGEVKKYFPFNLLTDKVYNNDIGNIEYRDFNNSNIEFHFLPSDKDGYKSKIVIKNKNVLQANNITISPILVISSIIKLSALDYDKIKIGNVLKLNSIYSSKTSQFNTIYELYKEYKYKVIGKTTEDGLYYITLDKIYPYLLDNEEYMSASIYNENVIHLNYLSIRGNPLVFKNGEYSLEDKYSIDRYGEKSISLKTGLFELEYLNRLANVMVSERKSVEYDSLTNSFYYDEKRTKFIAEFTLENYTIGLGDIIYITEDYYYNIVKEPFKIIGLSRINSSNGDRTLKVKALSVTLSKAKIENIFKEVETSAITSISSLDPTNYLTDKTILNTSHTDEFGEVYSPTNNLSSVISVSGNQIEISTSFIQGIDVGNIMLSIKDQFFNMVSLENNIHSSKVIVLGDASTISVGDSVYIYMKATKVTSADISYASERTSNKLYLSWKTSQIYEKCMLSISESSSYENAIASTRVELASLEYSKDNIVIGLSNEWKLDIKQNKYYTIVVSLVLLDDSTIKDTKITVFSPTSSKTIGGI